MVHFLVIMFESLHVDTYCITGRLRNYAGSSGSAAAQGSISAGWLGVGVPVRTAREGVGVCLDVDLRDHCAYM